MAEEKHGTDESVEMPRSHLRIEPDAEQNPPQQEMDERHSRRLSAELPYGLPTDDTHPTGTPAQEVSSGFSDLRRGEKPHLEYDNAQGVRENQMADQNKNSNDNSGNEALEKMRKEPTYDAEKEIPDPEQVERDRKEAEKIYGEKDRKSA